VVDANYTKPVDRDAVKASIIANKIIPKKTTAKPAAPIPTTQTKVTTKTTFGSGGLN